jgi:hypothetical protein
MKNAGRIHGGTNPMGTTASRAAHMAPNLGQVVSSKKPFWRPGFVIIRLATDGVQHSNM